MAGVTSRIAELEKEAARLHTVAKERNLRGDWEGAKAAYREMYGLEDEALELAAAASASEDAQQQQEEEGADGEESAAVYAQLLPLPAAPWPDVATRRRALGAVLGAVVADAAAMGVHWVYDTQELDRLMERRRRTNGEEKEGLDFYEPPQSPFFSYESGRASPYGEQTLVLLASLVEQGGLHPLRYAEALRTRFGKGWDGYRDASLKGTLRNLYRGRRPPRSGADDWQANCFTRLPPIVAAYHAVGVGADGGSGSGSGSGSDADGLSLLLPAVERATRVTQNADKAVAWARAGATVLSRVVAGSAIDAAVSAVIADLADPESVLGGDARFAAENGEIAEHLKRVEAMARGGESVQAAVAALGRNCHLPNSFQTPLHAALLYSLKGDETPASSMTTAERRTVFKAAVRAAVREGGCCASRATFVGACLGAWLAGAGDDDDNDASVPDFLPPEWTAKVTGWAATKGQAEALVGLRAVDGCVDNEKEGR